MVGRWYNASKSTYTHGGDFGKYIDIEGVIKVFEFIVSSSSFFKLLVFQSL
jgi:hypothetical protein